MEQMLHYIFVFKNFCYIGDARVHIVATCPMEKLMQTKVCGGKYDGVMNWRTAALKEI